MSPDVLSPQAKKWGFQMSLQERLFYDYDRRKKEAKQDPNVIYLTTNYRSNEQILQFSSDMFYGQLSCGSSQPLHPWLGPLVFYSAFGKEEMAENHSSHRNLAEVNEVVKRVKELYHKRVSDVRFLIPVLTGLKKQEIIAVLPKLIKQSPSVVKEVFNRLLGCFHSEYSVSLE